MTIQLENDIFYWGLIALVFSIFALALYKVFNDDGDEDTEKEDK